jgi:polyisoprenoid-binding protein YceI
MKTLVRLFFLILPMSLVSAAAAQSETFTVNPAASQVDFALAGTGHHVNGTFHVQSGSVTFTPGSPALSGSIVVAAGSGNSGESSRDKKMNSEVLNSDKYTEISFAPKSYQGTLAPSGDSTLQVSGVFTLHGTPHDITVPMQIHIEGASMTAKGQFVVPYVNWGLKNPSVFILKVAKEVNIDLNLQGQVAAAH